MDNLDQLTVVLDGLRKENNQLCIRIAELKQRIAKLEQALVLAEQNEEHFSEELGLAKQRIAELETFVRKCDAIMPSPASKELLARGKQ